jgi:hypothetical protein
VRGVVAKHDMRAAVVCALVTAVLAWSPNQNGTKMQGGNCSITSDCNFKDGIAYSGYDLVDKCGIALTRSLYSKEECCVACKATEGCAAFTYAIDPAGGMTACYLKTKNATTNPQPLPGSVAGRIDL